MKRVLASALLLAGLGLLPACAQRGGARGGGFSGGHASSGFHGSSGFSGRSGFASAPRYAGGGYAAVGGYARTVPGYRSGIASAPLARPGYSGQRGTGGRPYFYDRRGLRTGAYGLGYGAGYPIYPGYGFLGYGYLDDGLGYPDYGFGADVAPAPPPDYGPGPDQGVPTPMPYAEPSPQAPAHVAAAAPLPAEEAVTIVFRDGRAPLQVHNYALTRTTLYVRDQRPRDFPLDEVDIAATVKANHDAGVDFQVPAGR